MRTKRGMLKQIAKLGLLLMMGVSMNADAGIIDHTMSWKEEILLHDGRIIIAEQSFNLGGYTDGRNRMPIDETVTFNLSGSNKSITWKTDFRDSEPEPNSLNMILFDIVKDVPYIATYPAGCIAYNKWGRPNPPQILFKYEDGQWKRITLEEFPLELKKANIIVGIPDVQILKGFYTVKQVDEENSDIRTPENRTILREHIPEGGWKNCPDLIPIKGGGWQSRGGFKAPSPISPPKPSGDKNSK